jgi:uncharacterized protein YjiS (DUF1127 family)
MSNHSRCTAERDSNLDSRFSNVAVIAQLFPPANIGACACGFDRSIVDRIAAHFQRWRQYRCTLGRLIGLSSRELADVGIEHDEIRSVAWRSTIAPGKIMVRDSSGRWVLSADADE